MFTYTVPIMFCPLGCTSILTTAPTPTPTSVFEDTAQSTLPMDPCKGDFGCPCTALSETCSMHIKPENTVVNICVCWPGWEEVLNAKPMDMRGCIKTKKCESPMWNDCAPEATCHNDLPAFLRTCVVFVLLTSWEEGKDVASLLPLPSFQLPPILLQTLQHHNQLKLLLFKHQVQC